MNTSWLTSAGTLPHLPAGYNVVGMPCSRTSTPESTDLSAESVMDSSQSSDGCESVIPPRSPAEPLKVAITINAWEFNAMRLANDPVFLARQWFSDIEVGPDQRWWRDMFDRVAFHHLQGPMVLCESEAEQVAFERYEAFVDWGSR
ncbi:uncharacterized protein N7484_009100 [Penicillium longicatenatum]|uniref:uncharacterized protein n=1 Tax=Penicillium longicatenatum TaxID=1561947 RepID=UPI002548052D|nr:uncharacterized protein N7484_009100 [Penicillium longicatenatum]KAJ5635787.1 hypothetical protein N7484_009100 [Penicillium longicatenatum]